MTGVFVYLGSLVAFAGLTTYGILRGIAYLAELDNDDLW